MDKKLIDLKEILYNEIVWRYKELKSIKKLYDNSIKTKEINIGSINKKKIENTPESKYILRSSIPLIYAHWEGFFKKSIEILNSELDLLTLDYNKLNTNLLSVLTKDKHSKNYMLHNLQFNEIILDTESNLDWKVLEKFLSRYNLNINNYSKYSSNISQLVKIRNGISHGENAYHFEEYNKIEEFIKLVVKLMLITKNNIISCLKYKLYYKDLS